MGLNTLKSSAPVGTLVTTWLVPSTNLNSSSASTHRQTHPNQVNNFCIFGSHFCPCASPPQDELHCPSWLLFSLLWSRAEPWTLCYRGASLVFPTEHLVLLAVAILHPNFANVLKYFGVLVAVQKGQAPWWITSRAVEQRKWPVDEASFSGEDRKSVV